MARGPGACPHADTPIDGLFASGLDEDLEPPLIGTFYSLKGGVGRTTALAYTTSILAGQGIKVVCVDEDMGTLHILDALDRGAPVDLRPHLIRVDEGLELYLVPAGLPGAGYARLLRFADLLAWYREKENPLRWMLDLLRTLSLGPRVILVDARTGFHALNAPSCSSSPISRSSPFSPTPKPGWVPAS